MKIGNREFDVKNKHRILSQMAENGTIWIMP